MEKINKMKHKTGHDNRRAFLGVFLIVVGSIWILDRMGIMPGSLTDIFISWQMLLVGIGIFSIIGGNKTTGTILVIIGTIFLLPEIFDLSEQLRRLGWPVLLVGVGAAILFSQKGGRSGAASAEFQPVAERGTDFFDDFVIFGGREVYINSQNFVGGSTTSVFGGAEYDLRQANLSPNGAVVDVLAVFGGCGFKVPPDWTVKNEVTAIFGAFTDKRGASLHQIVSDPSKTLIIRGFAAFGGVEVKYL